MHFSISAELESTLLRLTNADALAFDAVIQSLWSGYGQIIRLRLYGAEMPSVVVKLVSLCKVEQHPRGWNSELAHQRKLQSYHVEAYWYQKYAMQCDSACRVARCYGCVIDEQQLVLVLEDLDASGFDGRVEAKSQHSLMMLQACLRWLAHLHGKFLRPNTNNLKCQDSAVAVPESSQAGLWPTGSYWHLSTRPDEWAALPDGELKRYAAALDSALRHSDYHTLIHGDAKLANFCFKTLPKTQAIDVAAVDFQYLGWGCGMRDVAYCISSALEASQCSAQSEALLDYYFQQLRFAIERYQPSMTETAVDGVVKQWRQLYAVAWADFSRFLAGWSPSHWKLHAYAEQQTQIGLGFLQQDLLSAAITAAHAAARVIQPFCQAKQDDHLSQSANLPPAESASLQLRYKGLGGSLAAEVVTAADIAAQAEIQQMLQPFSDRYGIAFVGEESAAHTARFNSPYSWLVDPVDGTLALIEGREGYAVSIGLITQAGQPLVGVIYDLYHERCYTSAVDQLSQSPVVAHRSCLKVFLDRSAVDDARYQPLLAKLRDYAKQHNMTIYAPQLGLGAALNACRVFDSYLEGDAALYVKLPKDRGGSIWDYAASAAIFAAAQLPVSDITGGHLDLNRKASTYLNHRGVLYASDQALAQFVIACCTELAIRPLS